MMMMDAPERGQDLVLGVRLVDHLLPVFPVGLVALHHVRTRGRFRAPAREVRQALAKPAALVKRPRYRILVVSRARAETPKPLAPRGVPARARGNDDGAAVDRPSRFRAQPTSPPRRGGGFTPNGRAAETAQRGERRARAPRRHAGCAFGENAEPDAWLREAVENDDAIALFAIATPELSPVRVSRARAGYPRGACAIPSRRRARARGNADAVRARH